MLQKMWKALLAIIFITSSIAIVPATVSTPSQVMAPAAATTAKLAPVAIGSATLARPHLRAPREEVALSILQQEGVLKKGASQPEITAALENYYNKFYKGHGDWLPPDVAAWDLKREAELAAPSTKASNAIQPVTATIFALAVQFDATEVLSMTCLTKTQTIAGPMQGQMAFPDPGDNNTLWYSPSQTADVSFYNDLVFGYQGIGRVRYDLTDPTDGQPGINVAGRTVQDYYDNVAGKGNVTITGTIDGWVTVNHSEGYYGAPKYKPSCDPKDLSDNDSGIAPVGQIVVDALDVYSATHPSRYYDTSPNAFWKKYDQNHDGVVDAMWILHAGADEAAGGGAEGEFAIWSHSWSISAQGLGRYKVYEGDPTTTADDIYVDPYTVQPENADLGVLVEEFGHNFFLWPDLYTNDAQNSVGDWTEMSGGSWMGWVGGTAPVGMPLWFRMIAAYRGVNGAITALNWQEPMTVRSYDDPAAQVAIGNLERTDPTDTRSKGVRINLPPKVTTVENLASDGNGAWAESTNSTTRSLSRQFTLDASTTQTLTLDMFWDTEQDYNYAYIMVNGAPIKDTTGYMTNANPNGGLGWGLTGTAPGGVGHTLSFDLSAYKNSTITLDLVYICDPGTTFSGVWVDNVTLNGALVDNFDGASGADFPGWTNDGWKVVPIVQETERYYLVEWRTKTKYDEMVKTAYVTTDSDVNLWRVERVPYNIPGALVYYRDASYGEGYSQRQNYGDPPSFGPKNKLLVVDMNFWPMRINPDYSTNLNSRAASYDAALTLQASEAFTVTKLDGITDPAGPYYFASKPAITEFNDGKGKYAGYFYPGADPRYLYYSARDRSAVIPARSPYSTRITHFDLTPYPELYEDPSPDPYSRWLGTGNPGDFDSQYGVNFTLTGKTGDDAYNSTATLSFGKLLPPYETGYTPDEISVLGDNTITYTVTLNNAGSLTQMRDVTMNLDPRLTIISAILTTSDSGMKGSKPTVAGPSLKWQYVGIPADQTATIEVVTKINLSPGDATDITTTVTHSDGMNAINGVSIPMITEIARSNIFLPVILK